MVPRKALAICLPVALAGAWAAIDATRRVDRLKEQLSGLEAAGHAEGERFVETLQGAHAERLLRLLDERREIAIELNDARRDRFLGLFAIAAALLGLAAAALFRRIGDELEEDQRFIQGAGPPRSRP
jgi:hypothetical protein